ncbi:trypsin-like serine protease [Flavobacterium zepuense]|uniref:Serine protease n=1 Tax=Flavobacterium zepuense TaxID=2593302 RepID=A0A552UTK9_9FLAO|nr:trypsin-like peptidase domain-containing protein [Flavobacterium zepuense]TRW21537.1 trypsin-like serine protease [Flavobacterium zepuense]
MGKQHKIKNLFGYKSVSNLDTSTEEAESFNKVVLEDDIIPTPIDFEPDFAKSLSPKKNKWHKKMFNTHGDIPFANDYPAKCICLLVILGADNKTYYGTGFMISPRCVITAGHCLHFGGAWALQIKVFPGADGEAIPYGGDISTKYVSTNNWTVFKKPEHDYGAIILPSDKLFNEVKGYLGFHEVLQKGPILLGGYPISENFKQITLQGVSKEISENYITYDLPTVRGNSGSPVYIMHSNQIFAVGVHTYGGDPNHAVRVTAKVIGNWKNWINDQQAIV